MRFAEENTDIDGLVPLSMLQVRIKIGPK